MLRLKGLAPVQWLLSLPLLLMGWASLQGWRAERPLLVALAGLACGLAGVALVAGPATWLKLRLDARRVRTGGDDLCGQLQHSWHTLGRCLRGWAGLMLVSLVLLLLYQLSWCWIHRHDGGWPALVFCLPLLSMLVAGAGLMKRLGQRWRTLEAPGTALLGVPLSRASAPAVWAWVERLAARSGAPVPDHLVAGVDQCFFVTCVQVTLEPSGHLLQGRTLYLPLTFLSALSQEEAAAIIGHELGHFSRRDSERGSEAGARLSQMSAHYQALAREGEPAGWFERPVLWMAGSFLHHFHLAAQHCRREQELLADRAGAAMAGEAMFGQALLRVIVLGERIDVLLGTPGREDLMQALTEDLRRTPLSFNHQVLGRTVAHPFDTHPPTRDRLRQLGVTLDAELLAQATRAPTDRDRTWFGELVGAREHEQRL
ncbi:M48 family metallopeptidase [Pseudomonas sp. KNUC1026]|uniref:M48 family metallopeptidase n=1 Tax=Pseudomonas sp. KNUC1026 TaxID=2893890 RepID=UPI001F32B7DF|nr:M48 family metallopeptidase [Pseudomonas sp. KNUC1026]UFH50537.1 M48 family metallopeptidase [Pseudomonas sp. KNUC1026]